MLPCTHCTQGSDIYKTIHQQQREHVYIYGIKRSYCRNYSYYSTHNAILSDSVCQVEALPISSVLCCAV